MTDRRRRVAVDGRALTEPVGGLRRYADEILSRLPAIGTELDWHLVVPRAIPAPDDRYSMTVLSGSLNALARPLWEDLKLPREVHAGCADVLFSPYGIVPGVAVPVVAMVHDLVALRLPGALPWHHRRYWKRVARRLSRAREVITNSRATADDVTALASVPPDRVTVAHLAPSSDFKPANRDQVSRVLADHGLRQPFVLAVGAEGHRKHLPIVAEAVAQIPDLELVVVGRAKFSGSTHLGVLDDRTLAVLMSGATAVVCPSELEGFGLPVVEAMACGAPVVASRTAAVEEVAAGAALLVAESEVSSWHRALERVCRDPQLRQRYREAGLARSSNFSWQRTAAATVDVIRSVVAAEE